MDHKKIIMQNPEIIKKMHQEKIQFLIGKWMFAGIIVSIFFIVFGGVWYLVDNHAQTMTQYQNFQGEPKELTTFLGITLGAFKSAKGMTQFGLLLLFLLQILRVALTCWFFVKLKDKIFSVISFLVLLALLLPYMTGH